MLKWIGNNCARFSTHRRTLGFHCLADVHKIQFQ
jgi:hypothetical protein